jgi:carbon monoxide dehydrogenase subunit G
MNTIPIRPLLTLKLATLAALALVMLLLNGCHWVGVHGNGKVTTDTRVVANFTKMEADGAFTINWIPGPASLKITTDSNLLEYIRTDVSDDRLRIEWIKPLKGTRGIKVEVTSPSLSRVTLNGAVKLTASNLSGPEFYLDANGATKATLTGNVNAMSGEMNGASKLEAEALVTRAMELSISGAGKASVNATEALKVSISGAGKVTYSGNPTVSKEINGAGSVRKRE